MSTLLFSLNVENALFQTLSVQFSTTGGSFRAFLVRIVCLWPQITSQRVLKYPQNLICLKSSLFVTNKRRTESKRKRWACNLQISIGMVMVCSHRKVKMLSAAFQLSLILTSMPTDVNSCKDSHGVCIRHQKSHNGAEES